MVRYMSLEVPVPATAVDSVSVLLPVSEQVKTIAYWISEYPGLTNVIFVILLKYGD
jgi:hypothetical protein